MSVVLFLGEHVYKLKKPVCFPFADMSTREARLALCHREVELNRRLAPDVYDGVADVIGPDGTLWDHLVVMRRMPEDRRLSRLVEAGDPLVRSAMGDIARLLAHFHSGATRSVEVAAEATRDAIAERWKRNDDQMRPLVGSCFERVELDWAMSLADRFLSGRSELFSHRIALGCVCDGHGDLLADDIFLLDDGPRILDCIEFDDHLRYVDIVDDIAFLVMDLERLGATNLADALVEEYEEASGHVVPRSLLNVCVAYRAQVRAMVAGLRAAQCDDPGERAPHEAEAAKLLHQCVGRLESAIVRLVVVGGLPGTGKTTVANGMEERAGWSVLRSDVTRKELTGHRANDSAVAPYGAGIYTSEMSDRTYDALFNAARRSLALGESVVIDASFVSNRHRAAARLLAAETGSELIELRCTAPADVARRRIRSRLAHGCDASDADPVVAARLAEVADRWPESIEVPTDRSVGVAIEAALGWVLASPGRHRR